jgi:hypothetical protein
MSRRTDLCGGWLPAAAVTAGSISRSPAGAWKEGQNLLAMPRIFTPGATPPRRRRIDFREIIFIFLIKIALWATEGGERA